MRLSFDSIEEVKEFVEQLKGTRGGKGRGKDKEESEAETVTAPAPAPLQPPAAAPAFSAAPAPTTGFPGAAAPSVPDNSAIVTRITAKIDGAIQSGQPVDAILTWFRGQAGPEAASATLDQIKSVFLPKLAQPVLENIAKLMNA